MRIGTYLKIAGLGCLLVFSAPQAVLAAQAGWVTEDGAVRYVDSNGNYVKNGWRDFQGRRHYLDSQGKAAVNTWVEDTYYVDSEGEIVTNSWLHQPDKAGEKAEGWYFLGKDGRAEKNGWRTIEGARYSFDASGKMRTGWHYEDGDIYYLGDKDQGYARTGWHCFDLEGKGLPEEGSVSRELEGEEEGGSWFCFQATGKARRGSRAGYEAASVDGKKYYFDENGIMLTGWHAVRDERVPGDKTGISRFVYLGNKDEGMLKKQWRELSEHPGASVDKKVLTEDNVIKAGGPKKGEPHWYYFKEDGTPASLNSQETAVNRAAQKIDGELYFFDPYGCLQTGLVRMTAGNGGQTGYFGEGRDDAFMHMGKVRNVRDKKGEEREFYFGSTGSAKGVGISGEKDGSLYKDGALVTAARGQGYELFEVEGKRYLVNEAGRIQTDEKEYHSGEGGTYRIDEDGIWQIEKEGGKKMAGKTGTLPRVAFDFEYRVN